MKVILATGGDTLVFKVAKNDDMEVEIQLGDFTVTLNRVQFVTDLMHLYGSSLDFDPPLEPIRGNSETKLTPRELDVLWYAVRGYTNKWTGQKLLITERTVESHRANIFKKFNLKNRVELIEWARQEGIL